MAHARRGLQYLVCVSVFIGSYFGTTGTRRSLSTTKASELREPEKKIEIFLKRLHSRDMP